MVGDVISLSYRFKNISILQGQRLKISASAGILENGNEKHFGCWSANLFLSTELTKS